MKIDHFDPPANNDDFGTDATLKALYSEKMSGIFDDCVDSVTSFLNSLGGGTCQFYNPVTHGRTDPDLAPALGDVTWNGFPKRFLTSGPGGTTNFAAAEPALTPGHNRQQDEYLEWHAARDASGKITSVQFTCEGYDYYKFLGKNAPDALVALYKKYISSAVKKEDLFSGGQYDVLNRWNTTDGAMHLTHPANNLFAEVFLAASASVRRKNSSGVEVTASGPLINCAQFGAANRNSDPAIGVAVNGLARQGRMITLANPVGLYIDHMDQAGILLPDGTPATGWFRILRGVAGRTLRAVFEPPAGSPAGITVSDLTIGGQAIKFGGQLAQRITMKLTAAASVATGVHNSPVGCGPIPDSGDSGTGLGLAAVDGDRPPSRRAE